MKISAKAEYACLTLAELALRHERKLPTSLKLLAEHSGISHPFLMQIFSHLRGAGLVQSMRGSAGGYQLARVPEKINLLEIIKAFDGPDSESSALDSLPNTSLARILRKTWREANRLEFEFLRNISLADLAQQTGVAENADYQI